MREITINKDSWHYRLLNKLDFYPGGFYLYSMGEVCAWVIWMVVNAELIAPDAMVVPGLIFSSIALLFLAAAAFQMLPDDTREVVEAAWETVHDKVCFRVRFTAEQ